MSRYKWSGSFVPVKDAQSVGEFLETVRKKAGKLLASDVVEASRARNSPLNDYFCWDDTKAAGLYRLQQARRVINGISVIVEVQGKPKTLSPCYVSVSLRDENDEADRSYRRVKDAMEDPQMRAFVLKEAKTYFRNGRQRYARLTELADLFGAIDNL